MDAIPFDRDLDCLVPPGPSPGLPVHSARPGALPSLDAAALAFLAGSGFTGAAGQLALVPGPAGVAGAVVGLGDDRSVYAHGGLPFALPEGVWHLVPGDFAMDAAVLGFCLGAYRFTAYTAPKRHPAQLATEGHDAARSAARATWLARDLINAPANALGPAELAQVTLSLGRSFGAAVTLTEGDALRSAYPTVAAVGRGSVRAPAVAGFAWAGSGAGSDAFLVSLCGKGVCFDSGGYDLKPSAGMLRMKKDMGGAALMLALARMIMAADLPVRLEVRIGCVENMVSGDAMRPLDVIRTRRGLTVEIGNTDAEGRLVLCDLLAEASDAKPDLLLDAATLTGAARVALGPDLPALFTPHTPEGDRLAEIMATASVESADPVWRLPLWAGYDSWLTSPIADMNNVSAKPMAGAIVAALFLARFVAPGTVWGHLDTYAWNESTRPGRPEGGEALGLRTLFATVSRLILGHKVG